MGVRMAGMGGWGSPAAQQEAKGTRASISDRTCMAGPSDGTCMGPRWDPLPAQLHHSQSGRQETAGPDEQQGAEVCCDGWYCTRTGTVV